MQFIVYFDVQDFDFLLLAGGGLNLAVDTS